MASKEITLSTGIKIIDNRYLGCGVFIENQKTKYLTLSFGHDVGFYASTIGIMILESEFDSYLLEVEIIRKTVLEANEFLNKK